MRAVKGQADLLQDTGWLLCLAVGALAGLSRLYYCVTNPFVVCWEAAAAVTAVQEGLT
jgi:hypothetical protein